MQCKNDKNVRKGAFCGTQSIKKKMSFCTTVYIAIRGCQVKLMIARSSQIVIKHVAAQREFKFFRADHKLDAKMGEGRGGVCVLNWSHSGTAIEH